MFNLAPLAISEGDGQNSVTSVLTVWNYHICYNHSYRDPMLYFEVLETDGTPASVAYVQDTLMTRGLEPSIQNGSTLKTFNEPWLPTSSINDRRSVQHSPPDGDRDVPGAKLLFSQEHHPFLHRPFYAVHPCDTASFMKISECIAQEDGSEPCGTWQTDHRDLFYLCSWLCMVGRPFGLGLSTSAWCSLALRKGNILMS